jgi:signal transduction histidine kinase
MQIPPYFFPITLLLTGCLLAACLIFIRKLRSQSLIGMHLSVFNALKEGVVVLDSGDCILEINQVAMFIFQDWGNYDRCNIISLFPHWDEWLAAYPQGEVMQEISMEKADVPLIFNLRTTSLFDSHGRRTGRVLLIRDITEQKQAQEQIAESSRMKSQLLASLGHDLRSPLGAIIGYAEMLNDGSFGAMSDAQVNASSEILDGATQLLAFMNNLVGQIQFETGRIVLHEHLFEVDEVIGPLLSTLNFHARKKGLVFEQKFDPNLPHKLIGDQFWLRQIVMNLVHNAVKFTKNGFVRVHFLKQGDEHWMIQVMDTGIGIPPESQKRVFEAFEQVNNVESLQQSGFGLGLSIVAKLTSTMQGTIDLKSEEGKGTTFSVTLPLKVPVEQSMHRPV